MQTLDSVSGLPKCLEFSQPLSCLQYIRLCKHGKRFLLHNCPFVYVIVKTLNFEISRWHLADCIKECDQSVCRSCSTIVFPLSTNQVIVFWRRRCCRPCLSSLMTTATATRMPQICISNEKKQWLRSSGGHQHMKQRINHTLLSISLPIIPK